MKIKSIIAWWPWKWIQAAILAAGCIAAAFTFPQWWPGLSDWLDRSLATGSSAAPSSQQHDQQHAGHEHEQEHEQHGDHDPNHDHTHDHDQKHDHGQHLEETGSAQAHSPAVSTASLHLTPQARKNLGLTEDSIRSVELETFRRKITVPAVVVPRQGRTHLHVSTPLTGVIKHVHPVPGETVVDGTLLFEIRLTHEDLVDLQKEYIKTLGELDVEYREIERLEEVAASGAIPGKTLLERRYAKDKLQALRDAQREALKLHGLSDEQVATIASERKLLRDLEIVAPSPDEHPREEELRLSGIPASPASFQSQQASRQASSDEATSARESIDAGQLKRRAANRPTTLVMKELFVHKGQSVQAGEQLCTLADYSRLYIEGQAFERDAKAISRAAEQGWRVSAVIPGEAEPTVVENLEVAFIGNSVDRETRTLSFFVNLPNEIAHESTNAEGQRYVSWRFRPGQRMELRVPVEQWKDQIVLPVEAVVQDGADWFVFQQDGDHFDRVAVHVKYRDQHDVVIAHDGSLNPGDRVAVRSAHQMLMAIKNRSGGGVDPHAGHSH